MAFVFFGGGSVMLETRFVTSKCENCQHENNISLNYFVGLDYRLEESVIAMCQSCNKDFVVSFDDSMIC
jgi:hypothetical protein